MLEDDPADVPDDQLIKEVLDREALKDALLGKYNRLYDAFFISASPQGAGYWRNEVDKARVADHFSNEAYEILEASLVELY